MSTELNGEAQLSVVNPEEHDENKRVKVQIREKDLLCINGCGFYGTPQWGNRCSKCWRAHLIVEKRNQDFAKNRTLLSFDNFQDKRKLSTESRSLTLKKIFKSPSMLASSSSDSLSQATQHGSPTLTRARELSPDSSEAREYLSSYLVKRLPTTVIQEITKTTKSAITAIQNAKPGTAPDDMSDFLQNFYQYLSDKLNHCDFFQYQNKTELTVQDVMGEVEKYVCVCCYAQLFCANSDEEVADLSLQDRIRSLHWVTAGFLELKLDFSLQAVHDKIDDSIAEIIDMNARKKASEKLECLIRCCHKIFEGLKESGSPTSADEFLPVLIQVLLKANPPLIQSNVKFISRFALPQRIMLGESGYFFTNLSCALQFVQDMNHDSLKMAKSEFEGYTSGELVPPLNLMNSRFNQALVTMEESLKTVRELIQSQTLLSERIEEVMRQVDAEQAEMTDRMDRFLVSCPSECFVHTKKMIEKEEKETADKGSLSTFGTTSSSQSSQELQEES